MLHRTLRCAGQTSHETASVARHSTFLASGPKLVETFAAKTGALPRPAAPCLVACAAQINSTLLLGTGRRPRASTLCARLIAAAAAALRCTSMGRIFAALVVVPSLSATASEQNGGHKWVGVTAVDAARREMRPLAAAALKAVSLGSLETTLVKADMARLSGAAFGQMEAENTSDIRNGLRPAVKTAGLAAHEGRCPTSRAVGGVRLSNEVATAEDGPPLRLDNAAVILEADPLPVAARSGGQLALISPRKSTAAGVYGDNVEPISTAT